MFSSLVSSLCIPGKILNICTEIKASGIVSKIPFCEEKLGIVINVG